METIDKLETKCKVCIHRKVCVMFNQSFNTKSEFLRMVKECDEFIGGTIVQKRCDALCDQAIFERLGSDEATKMLKKEIARKFEKEIEKNMITISGASPSTHEASLSAVLLILSRVPFLIYVEISHKKTGSITLPFLFSFQIVNNLILFMHL